MTDDPKFNQWWDEHGQFVRSGGSQYEISFAWAAWQAARATAEQSTFALQALMAAGHVSQAKVDEALSIAGKTPGIRDAEQSVPAGYFLYDQNAETWQQVAPEHENDADVVQLFRGEPQDKLTVVFAVTVMKLLRHLPKGDPEFDKAMKLLKDNGFIKTYTLSGKS